MPTGQIKGLGLNLSIEKRKERRIARGRMKEREGGKEKEKKEGKRKNRISTRATGGQWPSQPSGSLQKLWL